MYNLHESWRRLICGMPDLTLSTDSCRATFEGFLCKEHDDDDSGRWADRWEVRPHQRWYQLGYAQHIAYCSQGWESNPRGYTQCTPSRPEILGEIGTKTLLSSSPYMEKDNFPVMQVSKSCSNCFYIVIIYWTLSYTEFHFKNCFFFFNEDIGQPKRKWIGVMFNWNSEEQISVKLNGRERRKKKELRHVLQKRRNRMSLYE